MKLEYLRKIRIVVSIIFLFLIAIVFLDITNILPPSFISYVTFLQFIPSTIKFANLLLPTSIGFIIVLILTLLIGRVYCSSICPLGTMQDISSYTAKKINKKKKFTYTKEYFWLRYSVFALVIISLLFGNLFLVNLLDPYSNAGRIFAQLFNPLLLHLNNIAAFTLEKFDIYLIYPIEIKAFYLIAAMFPLIFLMIIIYLSYKRGRLYCNTICPVGTLLGFISKFTIFKLKIDKASCEGCGVCARVCKAECIEKSTKEIDCSRCVACFNCLDVCPSDSINYQLISLVNLQSGPDKSR
ncbi:MAG: 4Fe-4S binding protein [Ignavibacterium sp.]|nr:4Fe-4S binding protein [Ignavibacterium sp.]